MISVNFVPMFDPNLLIGLGAVALLLIAWGAFRRARGTGWRLLALAGLLGALANPVLVEEERTKLPDVVAVVVDESASQRVGTRQQQTAEALAYVKSRLEGRDDVELRIVNTSQASIEGGPKDGTQLFAPLAQALTNVPPNRLAGTILITDGQVHDVPQRKAGDAPGAPVHVVLTGDRNDRDRRVVVDNVPNFGIVGKRVTAVVTIEDLGTGEKTAVISVVHDGGEPVRYEAPIGQPFAIPIDIDHAGPNIIQVEAAEVPNELTRINNRSVFQVNGVRERLRVLLVSGEPHPGERVWRNFLKADPSVDLVHFTILRPPEKQDATPVRELSLIAFPIRELFEVKLDEFDLIIFDRYRRRGVLPSVYLENIVNYVRRGGALLEAVGPSYATALSLHRTPLGAVLPGAPTGRVFEQGLRPKLTVPGGRHPVTADLPGATDEIPRWGRWFRQIEVTARSGRVLMQGVNDEPLLIVDRFEKGRVAQVLSDHVWLWARGFEGGGPHSEMLRRLAHWLMREPDLEENDLRAQVDGNRLVVTRRSVEPNDKPVEVTSPSGETQSVTLKEGIGGRSTATLPVAEVGIYKVADGDLTALAAVGNLNPREFADMRTTETHLAPTAEATGGGMFWWQDGKPELRRVRAGRKTAGPGWAGLVENEQFQVASIREVPLLPSLLAVVLALTLIGLAWHREGR